MTTTTRQVPPSGPARQRRSTASPPAEAAGSKPVDGRERVLEAAYELFTSHGLHGVGVDTIVERAGTAKMTLYRHFASKGDLAKAVLERRNERWTDWVFSEARRLGDTPDGRLLAIFDVFDAWFTDLDFDGCTFITALVEAWPDDQDMVLAASGHLDGIHVRVRGLAEEAGFADPDAIAGHWSLMMRGSIVSAQAGRRDAAQWARTLAEDDLRNQPRRPRDPATATA